MTLKELNRINGESTFRELRLSRLKSILLLLTLGGFVIVLLWQLFDKYYLNQSDSTLFWLCTVTISLYILNFLIAFIRNSKQAYKQHLTAGFYFGTVFCTLLAIFTGASQSPYWYGLFFIFIAWFVLVPFTYRELILHGFMFFIIFMAGLFVQTKFKLIDYEIAKIIFLYSGTLLIGFYAAFSRNQGEAESYLLTEALRVKNKDLNKYLKVLEQAPGSVIIMDTKMNFEYINPVFTQLSGYTEEDLLHKNINDTIYKGKTPESRTDVIQTLAKGEKWQGELLTYHKTGTPYWANTIAAPYKDEQGQVEGYIVIQQDISEQKKMEIALRESEELYRTLIEKSLDGVALTVNRKFYLFNKAFCDILGYSEEELLSMDPTELLAPDDRERVLALHDKRMAGEMDSLHYAAKYIHKSGNLLMVEMNSTTVQVNGQNASFVTLRDITEQHTLRNALELSMQKYHDLADLLPQTVYELDLQGKITFMNQAGINAFGKVLSSEDLSALDFIAPEDHQRLVENLQASYQGKKPTSGNEYTALRADGSRYPIIVFGAPIFSNGIQTGTRGIIIDISERKAMENAIRESEEKYKTLIENSQDGIFAIVGDKVQFVNNTFCKMLGYTAQEIYDLPAISLVVPDDRQRGNEISKRRKNGDWSTVNGIFHFLTKDGSVRECDTFSSVLELNGQIVSYLTVHDLTESRRMQEQLQLSEEKYRTVIEKATDGIVITQQGKLKFMNKSMIDMLQYDENEIIDKPFINFVVEEEKQVMIDFHKRRMAGEDFSSLYRSRLIRKDGKIIAVELNARTSYYNDEPAAFIIIRDISDRVKIENELQTAKNNLEMLNRDLEQRVIESSESLTEARTQLINLQKENLQSQFDVLKQQVNPHFLFNSLNVLTSLIKLEPDLAEKFSEHLSKVYRYVLENKDNELVDLNTELIFLDAYIFLLNIRFVNKLQVNINIPEAKRSYQVIPLAMQLLIENAIKHNIMSKSNPLQIDIFIDKNNFLNIVNNLQERPSQIISTGVGLKNIQNRYLLLNNTEPVFEKTDTHFIAKVPLITID